MMSVGWLSFGIITQKWSVAHYLSFLLMPTYLTLSRRLQALVKVNITRQELCEMTQIGHMTFLLKLHVNKPWLQCSTQYKCTFSAILQSIPRCFVNYHSALFYSIIFSHFAGSFHLCVLYSKWYNIRLLEINVIKFYPFETLSCHTMICTQEKSVTCV